MGKRLIVAEKPSVGRDIANVLNCRENGEGCRIGKNDIVTWAVGHLVGLCYPDEMDSRYEDWTLEDLPIIPDPFELKVLDSGKKQFEIIRALMHDPSVDKVVCATDAGREGELIFRYIYQMAGCNKPVERLWISSLTYRAIKEGFENLKPDSEYDDLFESAKCRSEADWLIGMNGSRAFAIVNDMRRLSVGRVLSPTLAILVDRELERRNFLPEKYCEVIASFGSFEGRLINPEKMDGEDWSRFPVNQKRSLDQLVKNHESTGVVASYTSEEEFQPAQQLYDLTSLQRDANRIFGMSSKWTLDTAQSLYEKHKAISYPRTDSRFLSSDIKSTLGKRLESLANGNLSEYALIALDSDKDLFGRFINNNGVSDHHAIIPTGEAKGMDTWTKQEKQIYELICRRFIAMFFEDRHIIHQNMRISVGDRTFASTGIKVIDAGWGMVDLSRKESIKELPEMAVSDRIRLKNMRLRTDETKPPAPHTEASLLTAMEHAGRFITEDDSDDTETEYGIGTPATRAATIEKMIEKEMAVRKGRTLIPTEYGIQLISILPEVLQSPEMTGEWEAKLSRISKGKGNSERFMAGIRKLTMDVVCFAEKQGDTGIKNSKAVGECPLCGNPVREYDNAYYCVNKECGFRRIYKASKGFHPTLQSVTMRELLANGRAVTDRGTYSLIRQFPYLKFDYAPKPDPDYEALKRLIEDYGLSPVNKVSVGGGFWIAGDKHEEMINDFVKDAKALGCQFDFAQDSKALRHRCGWCHKVNPDHLDEFKDAFVARKKSTSNQNKAAHTTEIEEVSVGDEGDSSDEARIIDLINEFGFEYVDKRPKGGSLWIIAGEEEGKPLIKKCKRYGMLFQFAAYGGKATKNRPAWYSKK